MNLVAGDITSPPCHKRSIPIRISRDPMKRALVLFSVFCLAAVLAPPVQAENNVKDGVFIHISHGSDDPHRLLMALNMAKIMADDHDVLVYIDIKGVDAVLKDSPDISYSHFPSSRTQFSALLKQGATLMVCPGCLKAAGKSREDVADEIQIADKNAFFDFTKGRILTLDY
jgi:predicted peroxiredoxin